ncbi:trehalose-phosphatase [Amycolatopsis pigmentata]|uniref:Trehalose 6-phosphate phosphatase n=1 Tax=Amycolatopsis pigmentata TaxID=450801 RepID=A0ABW5FMF3_9PSEU
MELLRQRRLVAIVGASGSGKPSLPRQAWIESLVVAGSHGFDTWAPTEGTIQHEAATGFEPLIDEVARRLRAEVGSIAGAVVEPKKASVAVHYRLVDPGQHDRITGVVATVQAERGDQLKITPGKMVYELQPKIDWHKGRAVRYLLHALGLDSADVVPLYLGDDITDEDAFRAMADVGGVGIIVGRPDDPRWWAGPPRPNSHSRLPRRSNGCCPPWRQTRIGCRKRDIRGPAGRLPTTTSTPAARVCGNH